MRQVNSPEAQLLETPQNVAAERPIYPEIGMIFGHLLVHRSCRLILTDNEQTDQVKRSMLAVRNLMQDPRDATFFLAAAPHLQQRAGIEASPSTLDKLRAFKDKHGSNGLIMFDRVDFSGVSADGSKAMLDFLSKEVLFGEDTPMLCAVGNGGIHHLPEQDGKRSLDLLHQLEGSFVINRSGEVAPLDNYRSPVPLPSYPDNAILVSESGALEDPWSPGVGLERIGR